MNPYCVSFETECRVNQSKKKIMVVQTGRSHVEAVLTLNKYLDLMFCENAKLDKVQDLLYKKGLKAYFSMSNMLY